MASKGFDISKLDDATMRQIAAEMADAYLENGPWINLPIVAEKFGIPRKLAEGGQSVSA
ncbi:MAG: hypothetical protein M1153_00875 [Patescibacteria group bacterium]|nr:hypothetical protein [Patescibacteria group bacterium]